MPLQVEIYNPLRDENERWETLHTVYPGDKVMGFDKYNEDGPKEVFVVGCELDDSVCTIFKAKPTLDISWPERRVIAAPDEEIEVYQELKRGELIVVEGLSESGIDMRLVRFIHI